MLNDWRQLAVALLFVFGMSRIQRVNRAALRMSVLFILALAGYKTVPLMVASWAPVTGTSARWEQNVCNGPGDPCPSILDPASLGPGPGPSGPGTTTIPTGSAPAAGNEVVPSSTLFECDWDTPGTTDAAVVSCRDGIDWPRADAPGGSSDFQVVDSASASCDWSVTEYENVLQFSAPGAAGAHLIVAPSDSVWNIPFNVGDTISYQITVCVVNDQGGNTHGMRDGPNNGTADEYSGANGAVISPNIDDNSTNVAFPLHNVGNVSGDAIWWSSGGVGTDAVLGDVYTLRWSHIRKGTSTFGLLYTVYDETGDSLLLDNADIINDWFGDGLTSLADNPTITYASTSKLNAVNGFSLGVNGFDTGGSFIFQESAGFKVCDGGPCSEGGT